MHVYSTEPLANKDLQYRSSPCEGQTVFHSNNFTESWNACLPAGIRYWILPPSEGCIGISPFHPKMPRTFHDCVMSRKNDSFNWDFYEVQNVRFFVKERLRKKWGKITQPSNFETLTCCTSTFATKERLTSVLIFSFCRNFEKEDKKGGEGEREGEKERERKALSFLSCS